MAKKTSFLMPPNPRLFRQSEKNKYFYSVCGLINQYALKYNESFEWRENMMNECGKILGFPVRKKTFWQKLFL